MLETSEEASASVTALSVDTGPAQLVVPSQQHARMAGSAFPSGTSTDAPGDGDVFSVLFPWDYDVEVSLEWFAVNTARYVNADPAPEEPREVVVAAVQDSPGTHLSGLASDTGFHRSTLRHHVRTLVEEGVLETEKQLGKRRVYPADAAESDRLGLVADEAPSRVAGAVATLEPATVSRIADVVDRSPSTVSYHLNRLEEAGIVRRDRTDGRTVIRIRESVSEEFTGPTAGHGNGHTSWSGDPTVR